MGKQFGFLNETIFFFFWKSNTLKWHSEARRQAKVSG